MRYLDFKVDGQILQKNGNFDNLIAGTNGYLIARFSFSHEWMGTMKVASFNDIPVLLVNNQCKVPKDILEYHRIVVDAEGRRENYRITTNGVEIIQTGGK